MPNPETICEEHLDDFTTHLLHSDPEVTSTIAETNATGYVPDTYTVEEASFGDAEGTEIRFRASIEFAGDSVPDKPYSGDRVFVEVEGILKNGDEGWEVEDYKVAECRRNF